MKKKIYYNIYRRKWENDIVNSEFDKFTILPKKEIDVDGKDIPIQSVSVKEVLKKFKLVNKANNLRKKIELKYYKYIPREKVKNIEVYDACIVPQLFLKPYKNKKPYIVYIENSHSIFDYNYENFECLNKRGKIIGELKKIINDNYFKGFIFFSERSRIGFYKYFEEVLNENYKFIDVIYPMVKTSKLISKDLIEEKIQKRKENFNLIFISSLFALKGGCEIVEMYKRLKKYYNINITFITDENTIPKKYLNYINSEENLIIVKNNLNTEELNNYFSKSHVLIHPTYMDSTAIVVMEALMNAVPVIATDTFAIPEYIEHKVNGYIMENPIKYWDDDYKPLKPYKVFGSYETVNYISDLKKNTIHKEIVEKLVTYVEQCYENYEIIANNCYKKISGYEFNEDSIKRKWENAINNYLVD